MAKSQIAKRVYIRSDDTEHRSASPDVERLEFRFVNGQVLTVRLANIGENCRTAASWHGVSQKIGDNFASAKGDVDEAYDNAMAMHERLVEDTWVAERESAGPRVSLLAEAIVAAKEKAGQPTTIEAVTAKLKENEELRKGALDNPAIKAEYEAIKLERQKARVKDAQAAAKKADDGTDDLAVF